MHQETPNTARSYKQILKQLIAYLKETYPEVVKSKDYHPDQLIKVLDNTALDNYILLLIEKYATNTLAVHIRVLKAFLKYAGRQDLVDRIRQFWNRTKGESKFQVDITIEELDKLVKSALETEGVWLAASISLLCHSGLRPAEMLGLYWEDVHIPPDLRIPNKALPENACFVNLVKRPECPYHCKGNSEGVVPISPDTARLLKRLYKEIQDEAELEERIVDHHTRVFDVSYDKFRMYFYTAVSNSGIQKNHNFKITPHKLRHAFAHWWLREGGGIKTLQQQLRHKRLDTTMIYSSLSEREIAAEYQMIFSKAKEKLETKRLAGLGLGVGLGATDVSPVSEVTEAPAQAPIQAQGQVPIRKLNL